MRITQVEIFHCDAGWRPWSFIKITTDKGLIGWSECTDSHGSPHGIEGVVKDLTPLLVGQDPREVEKRYWQMYARTRQSPGSVIQKAIGGIENALLDIKAKSMGVSVHALFGGAVRDTIELYWSHCGTSRVRAWDVIQKPQIKSAEDAEKFGEDIKRSGFRTIKTNIAVLGANPYVYMPGFAKSVGGPELNAGPEILQPVDTWLGALRRGAGSDIRICLDLNFNFKTEGYIRAGRVAEKYNLHWLEVDSYSPDALSHIKQALHTPVCSGENLYGTRQYLPYFLKHAMDIVSIDVLWNGFSQSKKIADLAELFETNVTTHNYNGYLSTFINAQFCALIPNLAIMEVDADDVPWREELFTHAPEIENGMMKVPQGPGWGTEIKEEVLHRYPWKG